MPTADVMEHAVAGAGDGWRIDAPRVVRRRDTLQLRTRRLLVLAGLASLLGCQYSFPTAPSDLVTGIVIYEDTGYRGASAHIVASVRDLRHFRGPCFEPSGTLPGEVRIEYVWNDCVSSVRVAPGWGATLYRGDGFTGHRVDVTQDIPDLRLVPGVCSDGGSNDCVTSIEVFER